MQLNLFEVISKDSTTTFTDNMSIPIHRWFRYSAGYSAEWVISIINEQLKGRSSDKIMTVLDPFAGSGTTLLAADYCGIISYGYESHPLISRIAEAKLEWQTSEEDVKELSRKILHEAKVDTSSLSIYPDLILKCYDEENLLRIDRLKNSLFRNKSQSSTYKLAWLAFISILRSSSVAGTAQWQYILPNKSKVNVEDAFIAYMKQIEMMCKDIKYAQYVYKAKQSHLLNHDARNISLLEDSSIDLVITSPPYANNYDYADATRLEMSILGEIKSYGELQDKVRVHLLRSCSQMVSKERIMTFEILKDPLLLPIYNEIYNVCKSMGIEREKHGGKKNYHTMIALYFLDMAKVLTDLRRVCKEKAKMCFVIGDSAPYGIYVPVDKWIGDLSLSVGFKRYYFEKTRDRNIKWKNRKHTVPLKEGRLWIEG